MPRETSAASQHTMASTRGDEVEHFIVDLMQRFHTRLPQRYQRLALRRVVVPSTQGPRRVLLEQLRLRPAERGAQAEWWLIAWHLDRIDVDFRQCSSRAELRQAVQEYPAAGAATCRHEAMTRPAQRFGKNAALTRCRAARRPPLRR
ncbi:MAG: hypothetical protein U1A78_19225 [Polyangia bacterium]